MADEPIVVVSGLGRCGSSLLCQMLHRGGMDPGGTEWSHPMYECREANGLPQHWQWLNYCGGKFVKILNPYHFVPKKGLNYRIIWLNRDHTQQRKSWSKWGEAVIGDLEGTKLGARQIKSLIRKRTKHGLNTVRSLMGKDSVHEIHFEEVLKHPKREAEAIAKYLGIELDTEAMAQVVFPRGPDCLDGFLESANYAPGALAGLSPGKVHPRRDG